jgi:hypothetical protein
MEKTFIVSREKFLELKKEQKRIARSRKRENEDFRNYVKYRRQFYHSKGMQVPDVDTGSGFVFIRKEFNIKPEEPRYFNVIYSLIRGRSYEQIESKVREGNELDRDTIKKYCEKYEIDYSTIKRLIWTA